MAAAAAASPQLPGDGGLELHLELLFVPGCFHGFSGGLRTLSCGAKAFVCVFLPLPVFLLLLPFPLKSLHQPGITSATLPVKMLKMALTGLCLANSPVTHLTPNCAFFVSVGERKSLR